jgi:hypothetical protein
MKAYYVKFKKDATDQEVFDSLKTACSIAGAGNQVLVSVGDFTRMLNSCLHERGGVEFVTDIKSIKQNKLAVLDGVTIGGVNILDYSCESCDA